MAGRNPLMQCRVSVDLLEHIEHAAARSGMTTAEFLRFSAHQRADSIVGPMEALRGADPYAKLAAKTRGAR